MSQSKLGKLEALLFVVYNALLIIGVIVILVGVLLTSTIAQISGISMLLAAFPCIFIYRIVNDLFHQRELKIKRQRVRASL